MARMAVCPGDFRGSSLTAEPYSNLEPNLNAMQLLVLVVGKLASLLLRKKTGMSV